jgi:hypothetical protein
VDEADKLIDLAIGEAVPAIATWMSWQFERVDLVFGVKDTL